jgi:hypothetical protein
VKRISILIAAGLLLLAAATLFTIRATAQQTVVTDDNLNQMIAHAKTPADHEAIAAYYDTEAAENDKSLPGRCGSGQSACSRTSRNGEVGGTVNFAMSIAGRVALVALPVMPTRGLPKAAISAY